MTVYPSGPQILLIDDDRDIHDAVKSILHPYGYRVTACWTGPSGLAELRRSQPDLLLLDIMLSSPTEGLDLAHEIRGDPEISDTPIVLISAIGRNTHLLGRTELPADEYLEKPLTAERLCACIDRVLQAHGRMVGGEKVSG